MWFYLPRLPFPEEVFLKIFQQADLWLVMIWGLSVGQSCYFFWIPATKKSRSFGLKDLSCIVITSILWIRPAVTHGIPNERLFHGPNIKIWDCWLSLRLFFTRWFVDVRGLAEFSPINCYLQGIFLMGYHSDICHILVLIQRAFWKVNSGTWRQIKTLTPETIWHRYHQFRHLLLLPSLSSLTICSILSLYPIFPL